jgi:hypothetical protein
VERSGPPTSPDAVLEQIRLAIQDCTFTLNSAPSAGDFFEVRALDRTSDIGHVLRAGVDWTFPCQSAPAEYARDADCGSPGSCWLLSGSCEHRCTTTRSRILNPGRLVHGLAAGRAQSVFAQLHRGWAYRNGKQRFSNGPAMRSRAELNDPSLDIRGARMARREEGACQGMQPTSNGVSWRGSDVELESVISERRRTRGASSAGQHGDEASRRGQPVRVAAGYTNHRRSRPPLGYHPLYAESWSRCRERTRRKSPSR